ncbi:MAG: YdiU family protein [Alphaproteobacteria bacterium]|nr:YdiU family protein [Alphaproteobacteria bacterium]
MIQLRFDNSYSRLPARFFVRLPPTPVAAPRLIALNRGLAEELGLDPDALAPHAAALFAGNTLAADSEPLAQAYAGHQFGHFVPQLGDGRAVLLGELVDRCGRRRDVQLKGSGPTPFSRQGDGRAALGPVLREYLVSEAMHALGIPTTRSLAAVATGEIVVREEALPGAVLTRVAASHVRVGTFQFYAARRDSEAIKTLADYVIARHYPRAAEAATPAVALFESVLDAQASLVAKWLAVGFIHGVMNTDNTAVSGETIDYGPCAFLDAYDPGKVFSSIDQQGRYAYANQPTIAQWNLARFAETLLGLFDPDTDKAVALATEILETFGERFERYWLAAMRPKLGLQRSEPEDGALVGGFLQAMHAGGADFTLSFRRLADAAAGNAEPLRALFGDTAALDAWLPRWQARLAREFVAPAERSAAMRRVNPLYIPRNHRIEQVIAAAIEDDVAPFVTLARVLARPFDDQPEMTAYAEPPKPAERVTRTFCGT